MANLSTMLWELRRLKYRRYLGSQEELSAGWKKSLVRAAVTLEGEKKPRVLLVGEVLPDKSYLARMEDSPVVFTLDSRLVEVLKKDLTKIRGQHT